MALTLPSIQNCCRQPCACSPVVVPPGTPIYIKDEDTGLFYVISVIDGILVTELAPSPPNP